MNNMDVGFWALLHDGGIEVITGTVPGEVSVEISVRYLRQQFPGEGTGFRVNLSDCTRFTYQEYDSSLIENIDAIVALSPEILGVGKGEHPVVVNCVMGTLTMSYGAVSLYLDTGEEISFDELVIASKKYWDAWTARIPKRG
ncbi:hypothetical protein [Leeia oryzae]|uniref:hypothetical protein n=1 Tax=Leeia oryzae TaxID=356662 RepID=UPI00036F4EAC|nr:hypothetical protein [Leeia oryzae]